MSKWINIAFIINSFCLLILIGNDSEKLKSLFVVFNWAITMFCTINIYDKGNQLNQKIEKLENKGE
jgi:hypothetical protein